MDPEQSHPSSHQICRKSRSRHSNNHFPWDKTTFYLPLLLLCWKLPSCDDRTSLDSPNDPLLSSFRGPKSKAILRIHLRRDHQMHGILRSKIPHSLSFQQIRSNLHQGMPCFGHGKCRNRHFQRTFPSSQRSSHTIWLLLYWFGCFSWAFASLVR